MKSTHDPVAIRDELGRIHAQNPHYQARVRQAMARIAEATRTARKPVVAVSGGKDSMVVMFLTLIVTGGCTISFSDAELDLPETVDLMSAFAGDPDFLVSMAIDTHNDPRHWFRPWSNTPYWRDPLPGAIRRTLPIGEFLASRGHDLTILGTRASESRKRADWLRWAYLGPGADGVSYPVNSGTGRHCCPIWDWTDDDVFAFLAVNRNRLPINEAYDIYERIGIPRRKQRIAIMPLMPRNVLESGWPDLLARLELRYGTKWT